MFTKVSSRNALTEVRNSDSDDTHLSLSFFFCHKKLTDKEFLHTWYK